MASNSVARVVPGEVQVTPVHKGRGDRRLDAPVPPGDIRLGQVSAAAVRADRWALHITQITGSASARITGIQGATATANAYFAANFPPGCRFAERCSMALTRHEFYVNVTRKIASPLSKVSARSVINSYASWCIENTLVDISTALGKLNIVDVPRHYDTERYHLKELGM